MGAGRPKGYAKTGGRVKGTPNKNTLPVAELCAFHNCSPAEILIKFAMSDDEKHIAWKFQAAKELAIYIYPKMQAQAVTGFINLELGRKAEEYSQLSKEEHIQLMEAEIKRLKES